MITDDVLEKTWTEVSEYSDDRMMSEFDLFYKEQPAILDFVIEVTTESSPEIQELSLFLSYMVFKAVKTSRPGEIAAVSPESIEAAYHESESWIERINDVHDGQAEPDISMIEKDVEPNLVQYIISELNEPLDDGTVLEDEEKGEVFFVLKTVITSFARSPLGTETETED